MNTRLLSLFLIVALALGASLAHAQTNSGSVYGNVSSTLGETLPGVTLTLTSASVGPERVSVSTSNGDFRFLGIAPGDYSLSASLEGFVVETRDFTVQLGRNTVLDIALRQKAATTTTILGLSTQPSLVDAPVTVTAEVTVQAPGGGTPTGTITVTDDVVDCTITLPDESCELVFTSAGSTRLTARYSGDGELSRSFSDPIDHLVQFPTETTLVDVTPATAAAGQPMVVTAEVSAPRSGSAPDGDVTFTAGDTSCTASLGGSPDATASCTLSPEPDVALTRYMVTARYIGNDRFAASASRDDSDRPRWRRQ